MRAYFTTLLLILFLVILFILAMTPGTWSWITDHLFLTLILLGVMALVVAEIKDWTKTEEEARGKDKRNGELMYPYPSPTGRLTKSHPSIQSPR